MATLSTHILHQQAGAEQGGAGCIALGEDQAQRPWVQSEGTNMRYQPKLWDSQRERRKREKERTIPWKALTWGTARPAHRTKDWETTGGELAGCGPADPPPETSRPRVGKPEPERGNRGPREASSTKLQTGSVANQEFLGFCTVDIRPQPEISSPEETHGTPQKARPLYTQKTEQLGQRRRRDAPPTRGWPRLPSTWSPELLGPGKGTKRRPNRVCAFGEYTRTWTWVA